VSARRKRRVSEANPQNTSKNNIHPNNVSREAALGPGTAHPDDNSAEMAQFEGPTRGETWFPRVGGGKNGDTKGIRIAPRAGTAVVWRNNMTDPESGDVTADLRVMHAGLPPAKSTKYVLNCWLLEESLMQDDPSESEREVDSASEDEVIDGNDIDDEAKCNMSQSFAVGAEDGDAAADGIDGNDGSEGCRSRPQRDTRLNSNLCSTAGKQAKPIKPQSIGKSSEAASIGSNSSSSSSSKPAFKKARRQ
jgi:hypothetical protein